MPYAPGIQDISGQLIAQGMSQAGAARARSLEKLGESISGGIKQYQQNQMFTQQALGKFGQGLMDPNFQKYVNQVINDDPNAPQVPDALKKAFKNAAAGKTDIYDAALLGTAAEGYQQNQMRVAQTALVQAQVDEMRAEMGRRQAVARMLGLPTGELPVEPTVSGRPAMPPAAAVPPGAPPIAPEVAEAAPMAPAAAQPRSAAEAPPSVKAAIRGLESFTPDIAQQAQREAALKFLSSGQYSDPTGIAQRLVAEKRKQSAEERQMTLDDAKQQQEAFNEQQKGLPFGQRRAATVKESGTSGYYVLNIAPAEMTGIERQQMEAGTQEEKERIGRIGALITRDRELSAGDRTIAPAVSGLSRLLAGDKIEGDALTQLRTTIRSFGKALNFPVDEQKLGDAQTATAYFGQLVLPIFNQSKGSISDKETALYQIWSPQLGLNKKANLELLSVIDKRMKFNRKLEELGLKVDSRKMPINEYVMERQKLLNEYDESLPTVEEFLKKAGSPSQVISQSIPPPVVPGQVLQSAVDSALSSGGSAASALYDQLINRASAGKTPSK
jgi:hypothetical protein